MQECPTYCLSGTAHVLFISYQAHRPWVIFQLGKLLQCQHLYGMKCSSSVRYQTELKKAFLEILERCERESQTLIFQTIS